MMPQMLSLSIPGRPLAWARAGSSNGRRYTPAPQAAYMHVVGTLARAAMSRAGYQPFSGPVEVNYRATFAGPKKKPEASGWRVAKPDLDNLAKQALDSMSGIVFADDAQVVSLHAQKVYGSPEGVVVTVTALSKLAEERQAESA